MLIFRKVEGEFITQRAITYCPKSCVLLFTLEPLLQVTEIYNFDQDDLMTEDIYVLDCQWEIYVWVGQQVNSDNKMRALNAGEVQNWKFHCT